MLETSLGLMARLDVLKAPVGVSSDFIWRDIPVLKLVLDGGHLVLGGIRKVADEGARRLHVLVQVQPVFDNWPSVGFLTLVIHAWLVIPDFAQILEFPLLHLLDL